MKKPVRIKAAASVISGVLKLEFDDGYEGVVDLRPLIARGKIFEWLNVPVISLPSGSKSMVTPCRGSTARGMRSTLEPIPCDAIAKGRPKSVGR